jgi:hypothetical protein
MGKGKSHLIPMGRAFPEGLVAAQSCVALGLENNFVVGKLVGLVGGLAAAYEGFPAYFVYFQERQSLQKSGGFPAHEFRPGLEGYQPRAAIPYQVKFPNPATEGIASIAREENLPEGAFLGDMQSLTCARAPISEFLQDCFV